jgi:hypothetical protein
VFGVHEEATRAQDFEHLAVERALASGRAVMDREARHDDVEDAERARQGSVGRQLPAHERIRPMSHGDELGDNLGDDSANRSADA